MTKWMAVPRNRLIGVGILAATAAAALAVYAGAYDVAADVPHTRVVYWLLDLVRDRSVAARSRNIQMPPDLSDTQRIAAGAALYDDMCSGCHLAPGMERTEISQGLYPAAPELSKGTDLDPAEEFWIIKHGIKMSGMAAWGRTHSDTLIWDMVAFLRKFPSLSPAQYGSLVKSAPADHDEMMRKNEAMPGMNMSN